MAQDILVEIGLEELPARFIHQGERSFRNSIAAFLDKERIEYEDIDSYSTPRRLAVHVKNAAEKQTTLTEEIKGPSLKIARDEAGNWTKAATGFTKGQGKTVEDIYTQVLNGQEYIYVQKTTESKQTADILPPIKEVIESIPFPQNMRWGTETLRYPRPIRWIVALFGEHIIPFEVASVRADRYTFGHRFLGSKVSLFSPEDYKGVLRENYVLANSDERKQEIIKGMDILEEENGFSIANDPALLDEVCNLVEYPTVFHGRFDDSFLLLPEEVLTVSMKEHQRYFPVMNENDELLPYFVSVRNGDATGLERVIQGNEKVIRARLSDAVFFYEEDQKQSIDFFLQKLDNVVFQEKLGTITDKTQRIHGLTTSIADMVYASAHDKDTALRTAEICKFDLSTDMVNEFSSLQGVMGSYYARYFGESEAVAQAIREHYMPLQASGILPVSSPGSMVGVSDKLDTIVGCIGVGLIPTGSQDPYGLRRQAIGVLRILEEKRWNLSLEMLVDAAIDQYRRKRIISEDTESAYDLIIDFFLQRASYILREESIPQDVVESVLTDGIGNIAYAEDKAHLLMSVRNDASFKSKQEALVRILHLSKNRRHPEPVDTALFERSSEKDFYDQLQQAKKTYEQADQNHDAATCLEAITGLSEVIHVFFEENMVMAEDEMIRRNRMALVDQTAAFIQHFSDLSKIEWKQHF